MVAYSTREAARRLGITQATLSTYIKKGKVPPPQTVRIGRLRVHSWSEEDIERLRKLLPKIANGRKTRYRKKHSAISSQQSVRSKPKSNTKKNPQPRAAALQKKKK